MIDLARAMTDAEMQHAAEYFAAIKWQPRVKVIETELVPKTHIVGNLFLPTETERTEPIAGRIIEVPADEERAERLRDPRSGFVAYVPPGSLARGKQLVRLGGAQIVGNQIIQGKTTACTACHAPDLMGVADVPPIAGRSPSYLARQIFDIQQGTRRGSGVDLMKLAVAKLNADDVTAIVAYVSSKFPPDPEDTAAAEEFRADHAYNNAKR
jgi:cytochrome c553